MRSPYWELDWDTHRGGGGNAPLFVIEEFDNLDDFHSKLEWLVQHDVMHTITHSPDYDWAQEYHGE